MNARLLQHSNRLQLGRGAGLFKFVQQIVHTEEGAALMRWTQVHSCGVPRLSHAAHTNCMRSSGSKVQVAREIRAWMLSVIGQTGMSAREWAIKAGVAASTVQRAIKDDYEFVTSSATLAKLAAVAGVEPPNLGSRPLPAPILLPVRYKVQAGAWFEYEPSEPDRFEMRAAVPDPDIAIEDQWLEEVHGDSMNLLIPDDSVVLVTGAFGYAPREEDIVIVERRRAAGQLRERSIKQVAKLPDGRVELWPRSTNPKHNSPLVYHNGSAGPITSSGDDGQPGETVEVEIVGLVVSFTKRLLRR